MRKTTITLPELALVAGTRAALGAGVGLLLAGRLSEDQRRAVGWTLALVGVISSIPLAFEVFGGQRLQSGAAMSEEEPGNRSALAGDGRRLSTSSLQL